MSHVTHECMTQVQFRIMQKAGYIEEQVTYILKWRKPEYISYIILIRKALAGLAMCITKQHITNVCCSSAIKRQQTSSSMYVIDETIKSTIRSNVCSNFLVFVENPVFSCCYSSNQIIFAISFCS
jgi:hypothetical protein